MEVGGGRVEELRSLQIRDILAFAVFHVAVLYDGTVYGGFVREMLSGKHWDDIDIKFASKCAIANFKSRLAPVLRSIFGWSAENLDFCTTDTQSPRRRYNFEFHRHQLRFHEPETEQAHLLQVDITTNAAIGRSYMTPCTLGSALLLHDTDSITYNRHPVCAQPGGDQNYVSIAEVRELLARGRDIELWPSLEVWQRANRRAAQQGQAPMADQMESYHDRAMKKIRNKGYRVNRSWGVTADQIRRETHEDSDADSDSA